MKRLHRCRWDRKIAGVCGGIGQYFKIDPTIVRMIFVVLDLVTFVLPMIVLYFVLWLTIPEGPSVYIENPGKKLFRSTRNRVFAGVCGGIGEWLNIDPMIIRIATVILLFATFVGPVIMTYIIACLIIPEDKLNFY